MLPESFQILRDMADYYPLIARAIAGLDPSAPGESAVRCMSGPARR